MKITRRGAFADHGQSWIEFSEIEVSWNSETKQIHITSYTVGDFSTSATHNYTVSIPLNEVAQIIRELGDAASKDCPSDLEANLSDVLKPLIKLVAATSGVTAKPE